jgi:hypothetical protein
MFIWIVGLIFTRGNLGRVNPLLYILGFDIADVSTCEGTFSLVTRRLPEPGETIKASRLLRGNILLDLTPRKDDHDSRQAEPVRAT